MKKNILAVIMFLLAIGSFNSYAQVQGVLGKKFYNNWSIGVGGGANVFFGDLKATQFFPSGQRTNEWALGGYFTLNKQLSHVFGLRGQVFYGELTGYKEFYTDGSVCDEYFNGNVIDWNINGTINFSNLFARKYNPKMKFFVYGSLGAGMSSWKSVVRDLNTHKEKRSGDTVGGSTKALMGFGSLGCYYSIREIANIGIEWSLHGVNSDWVDVSKNKFVYDAYSVFALTVTWNFNKYKPGKEPDTNANKIYVPVYIPAPVPKVVKDTTPPPPVVIPKEEPVYTDTAEYIPMITKTDTSDQIFKEPLDEGEFYRVQIFAFRSDKFSVEEVKTRYSIDMEVMKDYSDNWYRYTVGSLTTYAEAKTLKTQLRKKGFHDAFITKYVNGERVVVRGR